MKKTKHIFKKFIASFALYLIGVPNSHACSIWYENRELEFQYDHLSPTIYDREWTPFDSNALEGLAKGQVPFDLILQAPSVYLAKAKIRDTDIQVAAYDDFPIGLVEFQIIETLQGDNKKSIWLSADGLGITPVLNVDRTAKKFNLKNRLQKMTSEMTASHESFWFWDAQIARKSEFGNPKNNNSCGHKPLPQVLNDTTYLVYSDYRGVNYIPVATKNDLLVRALKKAIANKTRVRLSMSIEDYFRNVDFAFPVTLHCNSSIKSANRGEDWWDPFTKFPSKDSPMKIGAMFKPLSGRKIVSEEPPLGEIERPRAIDKLNNDWPAIFAYYGDRDSGLLTCKGTESYLVYGFEKSGQSSTDVTNHNGKNIINLPKYRFAKIVDDDIISSSIKTNFALHGNDRVSTEIVMDWIESGQPKPLVSE